MSDRDLYVEALNEYLDDPTVPAADALNNVLTHVGISLDETFDALPTPSPD